MKKMKAIIKFNKLTFALNEYHKNLFNYSAKKKLKYTNLYAFIEKYVFNLFLLIYFNIRFEIKF